VVRPPGPLQVEALGQVPVENTAVEEEEGTEGLVLGRGRDPAVDGKVVQERRRVRCAKGARVAATVKGDEGTGPVDVGFFGTRRVVEAADGLADGVDQGPRPRFGERLRAGRDHGHTCDGSMGDVGGDVVPSTREGAWLLDVGDFCCGWAGGVMA
jgi:hypothetical protein